MAGSWTAWSPASVRSSSAGATRPLYRRPDPASQIAARAEPGVIARLVECQGPWCRIEAGGYSGWVQRSEVWGVLPDETVQ